MWDLKVFPNLFNTIYPPLSSLQVEQEWLKTKPIGKLYVHSNMFYIKASEEAKILSK